MKKTLLFTLLTALSLSVFSQGSAGQGSFIVKATPVTLLRNMMFTIHGEYAISPSVTLGLGLSPNLAPKGEGLGSFLDLDEGYSIDYSKSKAGFSVDPEFRWYSDNLMDGFFVGAYTSFRVSTSHLDEVYDFGDDLWDYDYDYDETYVPQSVDLKTLVMVVGPQFGWEKLLGKSDRFVFDGYIGAGLKLTNRNYTGTGAADFADEQGMNIFVATRGNVSIGYRIK